ncbi:MAG TPA: polysaccharide biosynthesis C-terminal domain-containing protein, partial [Ktedonobacterales bacterium]
GVIYYRVDTILLSVFATEAAIGVYGAAYRLFDTLTFIPGIVVGAVMSPILAKYAVDTDKGKLRLAVEKSTTVMLLCSAPAAAGLLVVAPNIIGFVYQRQDFSASEGVLQALAIGLIALYLNSVLTTVLVSTGQERKLPIMAIAALIFNVALNLVLIPRFMDMGAAWATSLTEVLLLGIGLMMMDRSLIPVQLWATTGKIIVATLLMAVVAHALDTFNILFIIPVAAVVYGVAVLALRVLPDEDIAQVKSLFARYIPGRSAAMESGQALAQTSPELAIAGLSERVSASSDRPTTGEQVALAGVGHQAATADGADLARSAAQDERSPSISVPLNYPVRIPSGLVFPLLRPDGAPASVAQRRMQRRLASLDAHQIAAALAQRQLGHLALSMRRIDLAPAAEMTTGQRLTGGRELAAIRLDGAAIQPRDMACHVGGSSTTPAYCLAIHRQRPQKPAKDNRGRRGRRGKPATVSNAGYVGRSSRPLVTLDPATLRSLQSLPVGQAQTVSKRRGRASGAPVAVSDQSGDKGVAF